MKADQVLPLRHIDDRTWRHPAEREKFPTGNGLNDYYETLKKTRRTIMIATVVAAGAIVVLSAFLTANMDDPTKYHSPDLFQPVVATSVVTTIPSAVFAVAR